MWIASIAIRVCVCVREREREITVYLPRKNYTKKEKKRRKEEEGGASWQLSGVLKNEQKTIF